MKVIKLPGRTRFRGREDSRGEESDEEAGETSLSFEHREKQMRLQQLLEED